MSEHITHIAVFEDSCTLLELEPRFHESFGISVKKFPDSGLFGSATRGNHLHAMPILNRVRGIWGRHSDDDLKQLAFALGWVTHRAADLQMKPLFEITKKQEGQTPYKEVEHEIYQDAFTFRYVYEEGKRKSMSPLVRIMQATLQTGMKSHPGAALVDADRTEFAVGGMIHSDLLELHSFLDASGKDLNRWLDTFFDRRQRLYEDLRVYIGAYENPDPAKMEWFITRQNFYNPEDDLLRLVRAKQKGEALPSVSLETAVERGKSQSQYTGALALSYQFLRTANDFFQGKITASAAYDALEIFPEEHRLVNQ
jgi:hypothetical protein